VLCPTAQVRNEKARRFLANMRKKPGVNFDTFFPRADKGALALLKRLLAFDPCDRPTAEEALADPYFAGEGRHGACARLCRVLVTPPGAWRLWLCCMLCSGLSCACSLSCITATCLPDAPCRATAPAEMHVA
jgi:hypothetical protein